MKIDKLLKQKFPDEIAIHIVQSYYDIENNYRIGKWKPCELDAGHFVEAVRRLIEHELFGSYTPFSKRLQTFNQNVLNTYESARGNESFRILIPRVLYSIYCIRNKRGVGHISTISPNKLDATYILYSAKWVLGELLRISVISNPDDTQLIIDKLIERQIDLVWDDGETFMILHSKMKTADKILVALYQKGNMPIEDLQEKVEYKNKTKFRRIVLELKKEKLIDFTKNSICKLSPLGIKKAEELITNT